MPRWDRARKRSSSSASRACAWPRRAMRRTSARRASLPSASSWTTLPRRAARSTSARRASRSASWTRTPWWRGPPSWAAPSSSSSRPRACRSSATDRAAMEAAERHPFPADASFDGGDLDCGNGLLLLIRQHMDPLERGQLLEFHSTEISVDEDFPAWCRLTGNELVSWTKHGRDRSFLVCKGTLAERTTPALDALDVDGRGAPAAHGAVV